MDQKSYWLSDEYIRILIGAAACESTYDLDMEEAEALQYINFTAMVTAKILQHLDGTEKLIQK